MARFVRVFLWVVPLYTTSAAWPGFLSPKLTRLAGLFYSAFACVSFALTVAGKRGPLRCDPIGVGVGFQGNQQVWGHDNCSDEDVSLGLFGTWDTANHAIATAQAAKITGVAAGSTYDSVTGNLKTGPKNAPRCYIIQANPSGGTNVGCPSSASTTLTEALDLSLVYPALLTGIGNVARVTVAPSGTVWNGESVTETVSSGTNTCPAQFPKVCSGNTTFTIGAGYQSAVTEGGNYVSVGKLLVGTRNEFFDQYSVWSAGSLLDQDGGGNTCTQTCSQQYYNTCSQPQQILTHTFTYTFTKSTMSGTKVTLVTVAE